MPGIAINNESQRATRLAGRRALRQDEYVSELESFIAGLPKAELHVHQVGSASPRIVADLAARHPERGVPTDPDALAEFFTFADFAEFIRIYLAVVDLVRAGEDVRLLTYGIAQEMAAQTIRYAELTVTPYLSVVGGIPAEEFCEAIEDARVAAERDLGVVLRWIFDIPADFGAPAAELTASVALDVAPTGLVGFGIGGSELGFPRSVFTPWFDRARAAGLHSVPHAGETTGPESIWEAVRNLGAERIGHGTSCTRDAALMAHLRDDDITVEVSLTSNLCTAVVGDLARHPIREMVAAGVPVTINTDDPAMFGTTLNREYAIAAELLDLDATGIEQLARRAVTASFAAAEVKSRVLAEIDAYCSQLTTGK
jgi:aminodeoxyfutalosine deaminase